MPIAAQAFTVLTEFKFDVGAAITNSEAVAGAVDKISSSAANAQFALARMSLGFAGGLFGGSFLGMLATASRVSDDFANAQIALANTLVQTGMTFEDRMRGAAGVMEKLNALSIENSLNFKDLLNTTKLLTPMLMNKGLAGQNLSNVTELSRVFLKSAPTMGVDPQEAFGQLLRTMEGQASMGDTLFVRLTSETQPMKEFLNNTKKWNALQPAKRLQVLTDAMRQFSNDTDAVSARVKTLSGQLAVLKNNVTNLLRPLGDVINRFLSNMLSQINSPEVMKAAKQIAEKLAKMVGDFLKDPQTLFADLMQMRSLAGDVSSAGKIAGMIALGQGLRYLLGAFGIAIPSITGMLMAFGRTLMSFAGGALRLLGGMSLTGIFTVLNGLTILISSVLMPLLLFVGIFQFLSRALAYAKLFALEEVAKQLPRITNALSVFSGILSVLRDGFDLLARGLGFLLDPSKFLGFINLVTIFSSTLEFLAKTLGLAMMGFQGLALWIMEFVNQVRSLLTGGGFSMEQINAAGTFGMEEMYKRIFGQIEDGTGAIVNQTVNMDVKMQNNFKEMIEPDRVAFTIKDQLLKAARNKTQASGRGFEAAGATAGR
jgi:hypothetical protein